MKPVATRTIMAMVAGTVLVLAGCAGTPPAPSSAQPSSPSPTAASAMATATPSATAVAPTNTPPPALAIGTWSVTGSMSTPRAEFSTTSLRDGRVLVAGGLATAAAESGPDAVGSASAEIYDPSTGKWTPTGSMHSPRAQHTAVLLLDGRVLVAGGICLGGPTGKRCPPTFSPDLDPSGAVATAELYDPRTGKWSVTGSMTTPRRGHTATVLADGMVLVAGAEHADDNFGWPEPFARGILASTELYDPSTGKWTATADMIAARTDSSAVMLRGGKVLVAGGFGPVSPTAHDLLVSAELYDPTSGRWTATGDLLSPRGQCTIALLADDKVLVAGGGGPGDSIHASAELYDPSIGTWTAAASMSGPRAGSASVMLANGDILVVGGIGPVSGSAELYDVSTGTWRDAGTIGEARFALGGVLLADGRVLVVGGFATGAVASSAALYDPASGT